MGANTSHNLNEGERNFEFDRSLLDTLTEDVRVKLEEYDNNKSMKLEELIDKLASLSEQSESERKHHDDVVSDLNEKLQNQVSQNSTLETEFKDINEKYKKAIADQRVLHENLASLEQTKLSLDNKLKSYELDKNELEKILDRKQSEIDKLNDEWENLSRKFSESEKTHLESISELENLKAKYSIVESRASKTEEKFIMYEEKLKSANETLIEKSNELQNIRMETSCKIIEITSELDLKNSEISSLTEANKELRKTNVSFEKQIDTYVKKLKDIRDNDISLESRFTNELSAKDKLISTLQSSLDDHEYKIKELSKACTELKELLDESTLAYKTVQTEKSELKQQMIDNLKFKDDRIEELKLELARANELLGNTGIRSEEIDSSLLSGPVASASKLLKSGVTLTQVYSEYINLQEKLHLEQLNNKRLNDYINEIFKELEEKTPHINKQKKDLEESLETIRLLTEQLEHGRLSEEKLISQFDDSQRRIAKLSRENERLKQETRDLATQIRCVLKELEESRGMVITNKDLNTKKGFSFTNVSSASSVISEKLITFKNITELQEQNQKLLSLVRELSTKQEEAEKHAVDTRTSELRKKLEEALEEIAIIKDTRQKQEKMIQLVIEQRDTYKNISIDQSKSPSSLSKSLLNADNEALKETKATLKELQEEFASYRKERMENEIMLNKELEKYRNESTEAKMKCARFSSQLDYSEERFKAIQTNSNSYKKEAEIFQERNNKLSELIAKHETVIANLKEQLLAAQRKCSQAEMNCETLRSERDSYKASESQIRREHESIIASQKSRDMLLANLEILKNRLDKNEFESKTKFEQKLDISEKECRELRRKLDDVDNDHRSFVKSLQTELESVKHDRDLAVACEQQMKQELLAAQDKLKSASTEFHRSNSTVTNIHTTNRNNYNFEEDVKELRSEIDNLRKTLFEKEELLNVSKNHIAEYKELAENYEKQLSDQNNTVTELKKGLGSKSEELVALQLRFENDLMDWKQENKKLLDEVKRLSSSHLNVSDFGQQNLEIENKELKEEIERLKINEKASRDDCETHRKLAEDSQNKYEHEVLLHANDLKKLQEIKENLMEKDDEINSVKNTSNEYEKKLNDLEKYWIVQESKLLSDIGRLQDRITELQEQNNAVHNEMERMSEQVAGMDSKKGLSSYKDMSEDEISSSSASQIIEIIRFLRKEKDLADRKLEASKGETDRLKKQLELSMDDYEDTKHKLEESLLKRETKAQEAAEHAGLLHKIEQVNLLQDSNRLMREEKDGILEQLKLSEEKVKQLQNSVEPLTAMNNSLQTEKESLLIETKGLKNEVKNWKERTNNLIEKYNKVDPEEQKKLLEERDSLKKNVTDMTEEIHKFKVEISALRSQLTLVQSNCQKLAMQANQNKQENESKNLKLSEINNEYTKVKSELLNCKSSTESKTREVELFKQKHETEINEMRLKNDTLSNEVKTLSEENNKSGKNIQQIKKLARRYKLQSEELTLKVEQLEKSKIESSESENNLPTMEKIKELETKLLKTEDELQIANTTINEFKKKHDTEITSANEKLQDVQLKKSDGDAEINDLNAKKKQLEEEIQNLQEKMLEKDNESKNLKKLLKNAKKKLNDDKGELVAYKNESSKRIELLETRVISLQNELSSKRSTNDQTELALAQSQSEVEHLNEEILSLKEKINQNSQATKKIVPKQAQQVKPVTVVSRQPAMPTVSRQQEARVRPITSTPTATVTPMSASNLLHQVEPISTPPAHVQHPIENLQIDASTTAIVTASSTNLVSTSVHQPFSETMTLPLITTTNQMTTVEQSGLEQHVSTSTNMSGSNNNNNNNNNNTCNVLIELSPCIPSTSQDEASSAGNTTTKRSREDIEDGDNNQVEQTEESSSIPNPNVKRLKTNDVEEEVEDLGEDVIGDDNVDESILVETSDHEREATAGGDDIEYLEEPNDDGMEMIDDYNETEEQTEQFIDEDNNNDEVDEQVITDRQVEDEHLSPPSSSTAEDNPQSSTPGIKQSSTIGIEVESTITTNEEEEPQQVQIMHQQEDDDDIVIDDDPVDDVQLSDTEQTDETEGDDGNTSGLQSSNKQGHTNEEPSSTTTVQQSSTSSSSSGITTLSLTTAPTTSSSIRRIQKIVWSDNSNVATASGVVSRSTPSTHVPQSIQPIQTMPPRGANRARRSTSVRGTVRGGTINPRNQTPAPRGAPTRGRGGRGRWQGGLH